MYVTAEGSVSQAIKLPSWGHAEPPTLMYSSIVTLTGRSQTLILPGH